MTPPTAPFLTATHATMLDREADEASWVMLLPAGRFHGRDGRGPYATGDQAEMAAIVARSVARAGSTDIVVDYDHQTVFAAVPGVGGVAPAAGWIRELQARPDGIWARIAWTAAARERIRAGEYRYISPVYGHTRDGVVLLVQSAGLTNTPNLDLAGAVAARALPPSGDTMKSIAKALGLAEDAAEDAVLVAVNRVLVASTALASVARAAGLPDAAAPDVIVTAVQSAAASARTAPDPAKFVPVDQVLAVQRELSALKATIAGDKAEQAVEAAIAAGKVAPAMKDWASAYAKADLAGFQAFASLAPAIVVAHPLGGKPPAAAPQLDEADRAVMRALNIDEATMLAAKTKDIG